MTITVLLMSILTGQNHTVVAEYDTMRKGMSALPPKADMCGARTHVRFGPIADIERWRINVTNGDKRTLREASNCDVCFAPITGRSYF